MQLTLRGSRGCIDSRLLIGEFEACRFHCSTVLDGIGDMIFTAISAAVARADLAAEVVVVVVVMVVVEVVEAVEEGKEEEAAVAAAKLSK